MTSQWHKPVWLITGPLVFLSVLLFVRPENLSSEGVAVLAVALWMAVWWMTEVIPISVTALLPIALFPLTNGLGISETTAAYGHKFIFLYMGSFIIAIAIERWELHKRIALNIIYVIGTNLSGIILGFMLATALLSMWISNTATTVMMFPIGMAIIRQYDSNSDVSGDISTRYFGKALMLAIAYSASIGGISTLIGTPPNMVFASMVEEIFGVEITFIRWLIIGLPLSVVLLVLCWQYLVKFAFSLKQNAFPGGKAEIRSQLVKLGKLKVEERRVLAVFGITALLWIFRGLIQKIIPTIDDTIPAILAGISLFIIPASDKKRKLVTWDEAVKMPWGIFILLGGGMALAQGFISSGLASWIANQVVTVQFLPLIVLMILLISGVNFLTEITSNMATTAMLLPVLAPIALSINVHPYMLMISATMAASCAFMLPVATPPNAIVFGSGYLKISDMVRTGVVLNIISIIVITLFVYFVIPYLWNFIPDIFPEGFHYKN